MLWLSLALQLATPSAVAQDDDDDSFLEEGEEDKGGKSKSSRRTGDRQVREITRGFYGKADVGAAFYLGRFAAISPSTGNSYVSSGTYVSLGFGQDFVDQENMSMAWELNLEQGLHNGTDAFSQANDGCGVAPCTEGDLRTYTVRALYEASFYPTRRIGIGGRVGGGVLYSPLLINAEAYNTDVIDEFGGDPGMHNSIKPVVFLGPTFEYYTKLSHFSVGVDVDVFYGIGWDLGMNGAGYLKYTF